MNTGSKCQGSCSAAAALQTHISGTAHPGRGGHLPGCNAKYCSIIARLTAHTLESATVAGCLRASGDLDCVDTAVGRTPRLTPRSKLAARACRGLEGHGSLTTSTCTFAACAGCLMAHRQRRVLHSQQGALHHGDHGRRQGAPESSSRSRRGVCSHRPTNGQAGGLRAPAADVQAADQLCHYHTLLGLLAPHACSFCSAMSACGACRKLQPKRTHLLAAGNCACGCNGCLSPGPVLIMMFCADRRNA